MVGYRAFKRIIVSIPYTITQYQQEGSASNGVSKQITWV